MKVFSNPESWNISAAAMQFNLCTPLLMGVVIVAVTVSPHRGGYFQSVSYRGVVPTIALLKSRLSFPLSSRLWNRDLRIPMLYNAPTEKNIRIAKKK